MKKRLVCLLLALTLCLGLLPMTASAAIQFEDGYLVALGTDGKAPSYVMANVGDSLTYKLEAYVYDDGREEYVPYAIQPGDAVKIEKLDEEGEVVSTLYTGTGDTATWTSDALGLTVVRITVNCGGHEYTAEESCWVGKPYSLEHAEILIDRPIYEDGFIYNKKNIAEDITVYHQYTDTFLKKDVDYTLKVTGGVGPGKCTIKVTGIGDYAGELQESYVIFNPSAKFKDIKKNDWFVGPVNFALSQGLFNGTSRDTFEPNSPMTRGMFVTVLGRMAGWEELPNIGNNFVDVPAGQYYSKHVSYAAALGIVNGISPSQFGPNELVTREQMCAMLMRFNDFMQMAFDELEMGIDLSMKAGGEKFTDHKDIAKYARTAVYSCRNAGIVSGEKWQNNYRFRPKGNATRAEVATIFQNYTYFIAERAMAIAY